MTSFESNTNTFAYAIRFSIERFRVSFSFSKTLTTLIRFTFMLWPLVAHFQCHLFNSVIAFAHDLLFIAVFSFRSQSCRDSNFSMNSLTSGSIIGSPLFSAHDESTLHRCLLWTSMKTKQICVWLSVSAKVNITNCSHYHWWATITHSNAVPMWSVHCAVCRGHTAIGCEAKAPYWFFYNSAKSTHIRYSFLPFSNSLRKKYPHSLRWRFHSVRYTLFAIMQYVAAGAQAMTGQCCRLHFIDPNSNNKSSYLFSVFEVNK